MFSRLRLTVLVPLALATATLVLHAQKPEVADVLKAAGDYLTTYSEKVGTVLAEEEYTQRDPVSGGAARLTSDMVFVGGEGGQVAAFRDVLKIDGRAVREADGRLAKLFTPPTPASQEQARAIADEGVRHYLSPNLRTLDIPTIALEFLRAAHQAQSEFSLDGGLRKQDGAQIATVKFTAKQGSDVLPTPEGSKTTGKAWIDVATGTIRQTELVVSGKNFTFRTTTKYAHDKALDLWLPSELTQIAEVSLSAAGLSNMGEGGQMGSRQSLEGRTKYTKYRRAGAQ